MKEPCLRVQPQDTQTLHNFQKQTHLIKQTLSLSPPEPLLSGDQIKDPGWMMDPPTAVIMKRDIHITAPNIQMHWKG